MAGIDKAAIGFTIGIVAVAVAIASYGGSVQTTGETSMFVAPPVTQQPQPVEPEEAMESQKTMEEMMEQQRQEMMEETQPSVEVTTPTVEDVPTMTGPKTVVVSMPEGTSVPGCEATDECFIPSTVSINVGDTVSWSNDDTAAHTVTSGTPTGGPDGKFDSSLLMVANTFDVTFDSAGTYDYFCMVHPWMVGTVQVG